VSALRALATERSKRMACSGVSTLRMLST
jgi:hypothetical protein